MNSHIIRSIQRGILFYIIQVESYNFLLHTWSLAVEMQYYLIVPLIFYILGDIRRKAYAFSMLIIQLICSLFLYVITYFLFESFSFNFTLCREWQFLGGTISYFYGSFNEENIFVEKDVSDGK
jgi:peptidoglycan/LPS O-acetylase OafA/YrhL